MGRTRFKWKCLISYFLLINVFTNSLPIQELKLSSLTTTDTVFKNSEVPVEIIEELTTVTHEAENETGTELPTTEPTDVFKNTTRTVHKRVRTARNNLESNIRPGQNVNRYTVHLTDDGDSFKGRVIIELTLTVATREDAMMFHAEGLEIDSVRVGVMNEASAVDSDFNLDDGILEVSPESISSSNIVIIEYSAPYANGGRGFHKGEFNDGQGSYVAMNLHPTHARRVFPCMDEANLVSNIRFTFEDMDYTHIVTNSLLEDNSNNEFRVLQGPAHSWGMVAHNFININIPTTQVLLFGRPGVQNQDAQASVAISSYFNNLNEWTDKQYFEIIINQNDRMNIIALPDVSAEWTALSTVALWEPYVFMESVHSIKQRKEALFEIANAMARQWFGYVIFPQNWRFEWVTSGLASYAAYEMMKIFQNDAIGNDVTLLDVHTLFVTDIIQESLLRDSYSSAHTLELDEDLVDEDAIRDYLHGIHKYKAPALFRMMRIVLGEPDQDFIQSAARALLSRTGLQFVDSFDFADAVRSDWLANGNDNVDDFDDYLASWITTTGYPMLHVSLRQGGVVVTQERFSFSPVDQQSYLIPITFTTSIDPDFSNYYPIRMTDATTTLNFFLDEEDWVLFNIQGQAYYRVNYDLDLWERIILALEDPERREEIHPLNRATLVDDALNLARGGQLDYDIAFRVVLSMEHETEYAVWKAFVRNMDFLRRHLVALVSEDEDLDPDIYLRMVRRTVGLVEDELGFYPDVSISEPAMTTLTRGLVMEHACRAGYNPCIAAAVDWFYDPNTNDPQVNPNIPHELRPAVYCSMVREGGDDVIELLLARLEIEPTMYERVVILESLACSPDEAFIRTYLTETIADNSPYSVEERNKIFAAVARSSFENAFTAINFISMRTPEMLDMYGGPDKLQELIFILADEMAGDSLSTEFRIWVNAQNNNLDDVQVSADRALQQVMQNMEWEDAHMEYVYEWIDENDASTMMLSIVALFVSVMVAMLNH